MAVITRLPQGGGSSGEYVFHISTNEPELQTEEVIITNGNTVNKKVKLSGGKATIKTNEGGNYTFICGMAKFEGEYSYFGDYDVSLVLNTAYITIEGKVSLAPPMDSTYQAPEGYDKPNSVDNFTVRVLDTDMSEDEALIDIKSFADGDDTLSFVVDITQHTNVKVEFSSEDGFITPESKYYTLGRKDEKSETITWVEKYAVLEVQREDPELLAEDVYLRWTEGGVPKEIIHHAAKLTDKSQFIVKSATTYTATCGSEASGTSDVTPTMLTSSHEAEPIELSTKLEALVPIMTSNVQDGFVASASANNNYAFCPYSNESKDYWYAFDGVPAWIQIKMPEAKVVKKMALNPYGYFQAIAGSSLELQASLNGSPFTTIWETSTADTTNKITEYDITKPELYDTYRLIIKNSGASSGIGIAVNVLQFYGK